MLIRKRATLTLAALALLFGVVSRAQPQAPAGVSGLVSRAFLPLIGRQPRPTLTPTTSPTPTPPFAGKVNIMQSHRWMHGWGWPALAQLTVELTSSSGALIERFTLTTDV